MLRDGIPGYEMWLGGSLGRPQPWRSKAVDFRPPSRSARGGRVAVIDVFVAHGDFERPNEVAAEVPRSETSALERLIALFTEALALHGAGRANPGSG